MIICGIETYDVTRKNEIIKYRYFNYKMKHHTVDYDFSNVQPMEQFSYDHTLASDPTKVAELQRFMCSFYDQDHIMEDDGPEKYQKMVESAIEANNLAGLEVLWQGVYYYDRDNPDYASVLFFASAKGSLQTFQHVLYAYLNYNILNDPEDVRFDLLIGMAHDNPPVHAYLERLYAEVKDFPESKGGSLLPRYEKYLLETCDEEPPTPEEETYMANTQKFYSVAITV